MANSTLRSFCSIVLFALPLALTSHRLHADDINNKINYIIDGKVVSGWTAVTADPGNWWNPLPELKGVSGSGKLTVEPAQFKTPSDAFRLTWVPRNDTFAQFSLSGNAINIKSLEDTAGLMIDMRVLTSPDKPVMINMRCGDKCEGKFDISKFLKKLKKETWVTLPVALNCFSKAGADLSKIATPFEISTQGKLSIEISNIRLQRLDPDDKGCAQK